MTISLEVLLTIPIIDAHKVIYMDVFDVHGAYLSADMPEDFILINIEGKFVDIMCEVNPKHKKMCEYRIDYMCYTYDI